jgi:CBS-domain-containing membrane protein
MEKKQIRRLPVLNKQDRLVGIVSLGDLAVKTEQQLSGQVLEKVSEPVERPKVPAYQTHAIEKGPSEGVRQNDQPTIRPEARGRHFR